MKYLRTVALYFFAIIYANAQEIENSKELTIRAGISFNTVKDLRLGALSKKAWAPKYGFSYTKINDKRISQFTMQFARYKSRNGGLLGIDSFRPEVFYSYERKVSDGVWIGGFFDNNTLLNFPNTNSGNYNNNPISYTISQSIGPRMSYMKSSTLKGEPIHFRSSVQTSLLSYVVQPAYGHPYPTRYLNEENFSPTQEGMAWPLMKSGKLATLNKYMNLRLQIGIFYQMNSSFRVGVDYNFTVQYANTQSKASSYANHDFMLAATYIH